jgi:hypothetical protein
VAFTAGTLAVAAAIPVWLATRNPYFLLPFVGVVVGVLRRKEQFPTIFDGRSSL